MKRIRLQKVTIKPGRVGLVTRKGVYLEVLQAGIHYVGVFDNIANMDMTKLFASVTSYDIMIKEKSFQDAVEYLEVKDNEIVLRFRNDLFESIMTTGRYFYFKGFVEYQFVTIDLNEMMVPDSVQTLLNQIPELNCYVRVYKVEAYEKALLYVNGTYVEQLNPGSYYFYKNTVTVELMKADMRRLQMEISGQEILTKDKAALRLNFFAQYQVVEIEKALMESKDYAKQLYIVFQLVLREYVGSLTFDELLENKSEIGEYVANAMRETADTLGVVILSSGIRDIILPGEMKDIMNQVLVAQKQAQANVILRREESASTRSLLNTAKLLEDNAMLYKLKEMEYVEKIADKIGEITLSGQGQMIDQLKGIFSSG